MGLKCLCLYFRLFNLIMISFFIPRKCTSSPGFRPTGFDHCKRGNSTVY